jgi:hypothetical protein
MEARRLLRTTASTIAATVLRIVKANVGDPMPRPSPNAQRTCPRVPLLVNRHRTMESTIQASVW